MSEDAKLLEEESGQTENPVAKKPEDSQKNKWQIAGFIIFAFLGIGLGVLQILQFVPGFQMLGLASMPKISVLIYMGASVIAAIIIPSFLFWDDISKKNHELIITFGFISLFVVFSILSITQPSWLTSSVQLGVGSAMVVLVLVMAAYKIYQYCKGKRISTDNRTAPHEQITEKTPHAMQVQSLDNTGRGPGPGPGPDSAGTSTVTLDLKSSHRNDSGNTFDPNNESNQSFERVLMENQAKLDLLRKQLSEVLNNIDKNKKAVAEAATKLAAVKAAAELAAQELQQSDNPNLETLKKQEDHLEYLNKERWRLEDHLEYLNKERWRLEAQQATLKLELESEADELIDPLTNPPPLEEKHNKQNSANDTQRNFSCDAFFFRQEQGPASRLPLSSEDRGQTSSPQLS